MTPIKVKKILYWCCYGDNFNRNKIFINGLTNNDVEVYEYNINSHNLLTNIYAFIKNFKKILLGHKYDAILFHSEAFIQFILAKLISHLSNIPLIHDIYISKLQTIYYDRQLYTRKKIPKLLLKIILYAIDLIECTFADLIILDTNTHIKYFSKKFKIPIEKFRRIFVGSQDDIFYPIDTNEKSSDKFIVGFIGTYIPLQGIEYIIKAAKLLEKENEINFHLIGDGQTYIKNRELVKELKVKNIEFINSVPLTKLPKFISNFDVGLGIFGKTDKTIQIIPNKIFDGIAMKIPMITCDSPAIRELFTDNENMILCERANSESLATAILKLKKDRILLKKIALNGYNLFQKFCTINAIGKSLFKTLNNFIREQKK